MSEPLRVAVANDFEIVVRGVAAVLEPFADRVVVVETEVGRPVHRDVDVVLYDSFAQAQTDRFDLDGITTPEVHARVVVFSWNVDDALVDAALAAGAAGYLSKRIEAEALVQALEAVHAGSTVRPVPDPHAAELGRWPGEAEGLSARESEVLAHICRGLSNQEIADEAFLGVNTVKTYIRTAYRKIGVSSRTQAVLWGLGHGFETDRTRRAPGGLAD